MKMKRFFALVVAMLLLVLCMTTTAMADGENNLPSVNYPYMYPYMTPSGYSNQYPYTTPNPYQNQYPYTTQNPYQTQYPYATQNPYQTQNPYVTQIQEEEWFVLVNNTRLYQDPNYNYPDEVLNFGAKVYVQAKYDQVAYVRYVSGNVAKYAYLENSRIAKPLKKIRITGACFLSPNHNASYDDKTAFSGALGGYRAKEDAFVLAEVENHYLILTDEGMSGWVSKQDTGFTEVENYGNGNFIDLTYYNYYYGAQYRYDSTYYYTLRPNLKLFKSASISSESNGTMRFGTEVVVLENNNEWCKVKAGEITGYVRKGHLGNPEKKIKITGETYLAPVPGMHEYTYSSAVCGIVSNTEAFVFATYGDYYQIVTSEGYCGFVYRYNANIQIMEELTNG